MSLIKAIKAQLGLSVTPGNNFTLDASADNGTMKLARNSGQDIMTVDAAGKVAFPAQGQVSNVNGYVRLPGGIVIQWGSAVVIDGQTVNYPVPFSTVFTVVVSNGDALSVADIIVGVFNPTNSSFDSSSRLASTGAPAPNPYRINWIATGVA